jgi:hypothetical protein
MIEETVLDYLVQNACFSADSVAVGFEGTPAQKTHAVITRALEALEANGLISITPLDDWPIAYAADPPYKNPFKEAST